jgi:hypothetical protein
MAYGNVVLGFDGNRPTIGHNPEARNGGRRMNRISTTAAMGFLVGLVIGEIAHSQ